jgi:cytochrome P450 family 135
MTSTSLPPGPPLPTVLQGLALQYRPVRFMGWCIRRYGDTFTLRLPMQPTVWTADPVLARQITTLSPEVAAAGEAASIEAPWLGSRSVVLLDAPDHQRVRATMAPHLRAGKTRQHDEAIAQLTRRHINRWPRGQVFRLLPRFRELSANIVLQTFLGLPDSPIVAQLAVLAERIYRASTAHLLFIPGMGRDLPGSPGRRLRRTKRTLEEQLLAAVSTPTASGVCPHLVHARNAGELSSEELSDQLVTLLLAGYVTTATGLAWTVELLLRSPTALERTLTDTSDTWLDAVVRESLRLRPPLAGSFRVLHQQWRLGDWELPTGVTLGADFYHAQQRSTGVSDFDEFRPERHLATLPGDAPQPHWFPFGGGVRHCLGSAFALMEMKVVLRTMFQEIRLQAADIRPEPITLHGPMLSPVRGVPVVIPRHVLRDKTSASSPTNTASLIHNPTVIEEKNRP